MDENKVGTKMTMSNEAEEVVRAVLSMTRKLGGNVANILQDETDVKEVLSALHKSGFVVVPIGLLKALKEMLDKVVDTNYVRGGD
jgi:hypothetical protein